MPDRQMRCLQNKATVSYYLLLDNRRKLTTDAYLREELSEANDAKMQHPSGAAMPTSPPCITTHVLPPPVCQTLLHE